MTSQPDPKDGPPCKQCALEDKNPGWVIPLEVHECGGDRGNPLMDRDHWAASRTDVEAAWTRLEAFCRKRIAGPTATILTDLATVQAAVRVVPPEGGPRADAEDVSETAAILMAMDAWRSTADGEKFDRACPPIVYGIARSAYRMGRASGAGTRQNTEPRKIILRNSEDNPQSAAGGQPPSDGMPSVLSEEGVEAAYRAFCRDWPYELSPRVRPSLFAALQAYLAAERGVSAVPPTEEPK